MMKTFLLRADAAGGSTEGDYFILGELEQSSATQSFVADVATR